MYADKKKAEQAATRLLSVHNINELKVPVKSLARATGCVLKTVPLDDDLSGMAFLRDGTKVIAVNSAHHSNRQRFTVAHELAHHHLHLPLLEQGVHVDKVIFRRDQISTKGVEPYEVEANAFAAELLMPKATIRKIIPSSIDLNDEDLLGRFATDFGVSSSALYFRIMNAFS